MGANSCLTNVAYQHACIKLPLIGVVHVQPGYSHAFFYRSIHQKLI